VHATIAHFENTRIHPLHAPKSSSHCNFIAHQHMCPYPSLPIPSPSHPQTKLEAVHLALFERHLACHRHCSRRVSCTRALACRAAGRLIKGAGHSSWVWSAAWSPDGTKIATGSYDGTARVWNSSSGSTLLTLTGHGLMVLCVAWSPDGMKIASRNPGNTECNNNRRLLTRARAAAQAHSTRHRITPPPRYRAGT
jgi:hypothetical protein